MKADLGAGIALDVKLKRFSGPAGSNGDGYRYRLKLEDGFRVLEVLRITP